jgi:hypothetical protein
MNKKTKQKQNNIIGNSNSDINNSTSSNYLSSLSTDRSSNSEEKINK